jgi:uncharacterized protein (DUF736 family)
MTEIGRLRETTPGSLAKLTGHISTMEQTFAVRLEGDESLCDTPCASYRIYARNRTGVDVQIGSAWCKTAKRGARAGERFLTLSIDFPGLPVALNVAAFRDPASGEWVVTWRRRGTRNAEEAAA